MVWTKSIQTLWKKISAKQILVTGLILRLVLAPITYHGDVIVNYWWGKFATEFGLKGYYNWLEFGGYARPDQPMLYILYYRQVRKVFELFYQIFWFLNVKISIFPSKFMQWYFLEGNQIMEKFFIIFSEILLVYLVYLFIKKYFDKEKAKVALLILVFYLPLIYNSALWGGNDSLLNLLGLSALYLFYKRKYIFASLLFTACLLFKSSLFILGPLVLIILIKQKIKLKEWLKVILPSLILLYLCAKPFAPYFVPQWLYETYTQKILTGSMPQLTANAFNIWALIFGLVPRNDSLRILNLFSARQLSYIFCLILSFIAYFRLYKNYTLKNILITITNLVLISFMFMTRMHERYTFPALIPLFILCFYDKSYCKYFVVLTITHLLNVYNWWYFPRIDFLVSFLNNDLSIRLLSLVNLLLTAILFIKNAKK